MWSIFTGPMQVHLFLCLSKEYGFISCMQVGFLELKWVIKSSADARMVYTNIR